MWHKLFIYEQVGFPIMYSVARLNSSQMEYSGLFQSVAVIWATIIIMLWRRRRNVGVIAASYDSIQSQSSSVVVAGVYTEVRPEEGGELERVFVIRYKLFRKFVDESRQSFVAFILSPIEFGHIRSRSSKVVIDTCVLNKFLTWFVLPMIWILYQTNLRIYYNCPL